MIIPVEMPYLKVPCILAVTFLQYLFLAAATFLLLEALVIMHKLVDAVILPLLENPLFILAVGTVLPAYSILMTCTG